MFDDIVEIEECGPERSNELLQAGYKLLAITPIATARRFKGEGAPMAYVRKEIVYTVGRPCGVTRSADKPDDEMVTPS